MPSKEYMKEYYKKNKEKINEKDRIYYENNKEHKKEYYENNKEHIKEHVKEYRQTDTCKKSFIIGNWRHSGLICENIEELYKHYINTFECENCGIELVTGPRVSNSKCMDHCHKTRKFRNILCHTCNVQRGYDDRSNN